MSPPDTNLEKQRRRHIGPLVGMAAAVTFAVVLFLGWVFYEVDEGTPPAGADVQIDGRTGESEVQTPDAGEVTGP